MVRIVYIDVDLLRPDHKGCYGYKRLTTPHIDELARVLVKCLAQVTF